MDVTVMYGNACQGPVGAACLLETSGDPAGTPTRAQPPLVRSTADAG